MQHKYKKFRQEQVKINVSSSFIARCKCVECASQPVYYYKSYMSAYFKDFGDSKKLFFLFKKHITRLTSDWYLEFQPRYFYSMADFSSGWMDRGFKPKLHHTRGVPAFNTVIEFLTCSCGKTTWAFAQASVQNRPEITNRKARYKYPKTYSSW